MDSTPDFQITKFIVHVVNNRNSMLEMSDYETPVNAAFPHEFFKQYILYALGHNLRRHACFRNQDGPVSAAFRRMLAQPRDFVPASKEVAGRLYQAMSEGPYRRLIKPGDIMVALLEETAGADAPSSTWLAVLKIDPSEGVIRRLVSRRGAQQVLFERRHDRVPTVRESEVQKIAVIYDRLRAVPEPHELLLLDNNIKDRKVARFFCNDFLGARLNRDAREVTALLDDRVKRFVSKQPLAPVEKKSAVSRTQALMRRGRPITVQSLATAAAKATGRNPKEARQLAADLALDITTYGPKENRIDPGELLPVHVDTAKMRSDTLTYILDGVIQVTGPTAVMESQVAITETPGGGLTVTIHAKTLGVG